MDGEEKLMRATGILRRIDNLGRVAVPKELRRSLCISEGEPVEIFIEKEKVVIKKYSPVLEMKKIVTEFVHVVHEILSGNVFVTDRDQVVASSEPDQIGEKIDCTIEKVLEGDAIIESHLAIFPIRSEGFILGAVGLRRKDIDATALKVAKMTASIIGKQLDSAS
jgi:AbrB family transcriptional regulator (stage V sporulation protein T)